MANEYASTTAVIARVPSLDTFDSGELGDILEAASRGIDSYCARKFWLDPVATSRDFKAIDFYELDLGAHEIGTTANVTVATDDGDGTFGTVLAASDYLLEPVNAPHEPAGARPYTMLRSLTGSWPMTYVRQGRQERVRVTARYGWPAVPLAVREACIALVIDEVENPTRVRGEAIDGYSVQYDVAMAIQSSPAIRSKLTPFRRGWAV